MLRVPLRWSGQCGSRMESAGIVCVTHCSSVSVGFRSQDFDWADYLKQCGAEAAPQKCFPQVSPCGTASGWGLWCCCALMISLCSQSAPSTRSPPLVIKQSKDIAFTAQGSLLSKLVLQVYMVFFFLGKVMWIWNFISYFSGSIMSKLLILEKNGSIYLKILLSQQYMSMF